MDFLVNLEVNLGDFGGWISYLNSNVKIFFARCARGVPLLPFPTFDMAPRSLANFALACTSSMARVF